MMNWLHAVHFYAVLVLTSVVVSGLSAQTPKEMTNSIGMKLVLIPKGTFKMGSPPSEVDAEEDETIHDVTISKDFYLSITEVTQEQYQKVMGLNPSHFRDSPNNPVENVSWEDAVKFCGRLSDLAEEKKANRIYRLPTEAEWEYACRAGSRTAYSFGNDSRSLTDFDWIRDNSGDKPHPVGQKKPNRWGLYDMHGNVWEWCSDWYGDYPNGAVVNPVGPDQGVLRVCRSGTWDADAAICRSATRSSDDPKSRSYFSGFRVALCPVAISR